jgi:uncharacterized protein (DUF849 family)
MSDSRHPYLKACINGARTPDRHPELPVTPQQLADAALAAHRAGALAVHLHPKSADGDADGDAVTADDLLARINRADSPAPVLLHGLDDSCWPLLRHAGRRGLQTRIGLEDTLLLPDGSTAPGNAELVRAAIEVLGAVSR